MPKISRARFLTVLDTCSCQMDVERVSDTPNYSPKKKLQKGEQVQEVRKVTASRGTLIKVATQEGKFYYLKETDLWNLK